MLTCGRCSAPALSLRCGSVSTKCLYPLCSSGDSVLSAIHKSAITKGSQEDKHTFRPKGHAGLFHACKSRKPCEALLGKMAP